MPISRRDKLIKRDMVFGKDVNLLSRNSNIRKFVKRPKFAGKNSMDVSLKYNSCNDINCVITSGIRSIWFELKSKICKRLHDFKLSLTVTMPIYILGIIKPKNY